MRRPAASLSCGLVAAVLLCLGGAGRLAAQSAPPGTDRALVLNGQGWATIPDRADLFDFVPGGERTISVWLQYDRPQYFARIFRKGTPEGVEPRRGWTVFVQQYTASLGFWHHAGIPLDEETGYTQAGSAGHRDLGDGAWHHVAIVQRDTLVEGWADGRLQFQVSIARTVDDLATNDPVSLGWYNEDVIRFQGAMDELSLWSRALTPWELRRLAYHKPAPGTPGLEGYWPMDSASGNRLVDASGHGWDGEGTDLEWADSTRPLAPPFRDRPSFFVVVTALSLGALYGAMRLYGLRLERQKRKLEQQVEARVRDLAEANKEKDRALTIVESQAERLKEINDARARFFTNISHEFRTPLSLIVGPLSDTLTRPGSALDEESRLAVRTALTSGRRLGHLTGQLLELARLETETLHLDLQPLDLTALAGELTQAFRLAAQRDGVELEATLPSEPTPIRGDTHRLETVFSNLLANALRFTPRGKTIRVRMEKVGGQVVVEVRDEGPGIPESHRERVFERFYQTPTGIRTGGGMGVGLALVRDLIELHQGTVALLDHEGPGALFRVTLPLSDDAFPETAVPAPELVPLPMPSDDASERTPDHLVSGSPDDNERLLPPLVLVVEDNAELRAFLEGHLGREFRVGQAPEGAAALALAREETPDVIVSDVMMGGMDGLAMLSALRDDEELDTVPVILLSAHADLSDRLEGLERGADVYLPKPFEPVELTTQIRGLLAARERLRHRLLSELGASDAPAEPATDGAEAAEVAELRARLTAAVEAHLTDPAFDVNDLAAHVAMERTGLYKVMMAEMDISPSDFIRKIRLTRAARLLEEGNTVAEVAYGIGYRSVSSFSRRFRDHFSCRPGQWARERSTSDS